MDNADGDFDPGGGGADGFSALTAGQDRGPLVAEAIDLLDSQHVPVADVGQRVQQREPIVCLSVLTRTRPMSAMRPPSVHQNVLCEVDEP